MSKETLQITAEENKNNIATLKIDVGRIRRSDAKMTPKKRKQFLEYFAQHFNFSKAAAQVGVTKQSIYELLRRDAKFKEAFDLIDEYLTDSIESISINQSLLPREGFQDRRLQLQARRPEKYGKQALVQVNNSIKIENPRAEVETILNEIPSINHEKTKG